MTKLYANENFAREVVARLRALGHDVLTTAEAGQANQRTPDAEVLAFARSQGRAVVTRNRRDFRYLHRDNADHCGIVLCSDELDFAGQADRIDSAITNVGDLKGKLLQVKKPHA